MPASILQKQLKETLERILVEHTAGGDAGAGAGAPTETAFMVTELVNLLPESIDEAQSLVPALTHFLNEHAYSNKELILQKMIDEISIIVASSNR